MFRSKGDNKNIETKWIFIIICELKKRNHTEKTFEETIENNIEFKNIWRKETPIKKTGKGKYSAI